MNWITILCLSLLLSFVQVQSLIQLLVNIYMKMFTLDLKYTLFSTHFMKLHNFAFCFWTGNKLLMSATTANTSQNVSWSAIVSDYIE